MGEPLPGRDQSSRARAAGTVGLGRGGVRRYARPISAPPDDVASQLERLLEDRPPRDAGGDEPDEDVTEATEEATATVPPVPPSRPTSLDDEEVAVVRRAVVEELDELRGQLDAAFEEVIGRVNRVELRLSALRAATAAQADAVNDIANRTNDTHSLLERVATTLDDAVASAGDGPPGDDLDRLDAAIGHLSQQVSSLRETPTRIDTRHLEDATREGALRNAADIANLAKDVEALTAAVTQQDKGLAELRATLEWIKQRLLSR